MRSTTWRRRESPSSGEQEIGTGRATGAGALTRRVVLGGIVTSAVAAVLAGCTDDRSAAVPPVIVDPPEPTEPTPETWTGPRVDVEAIDNTFRPKEIEVVQGTMVVWRNAGHNRHDVLSIHAEWGVTPEQFPVDRDYGHVFTEPGEFDYYCTVHGTPTIGMIGKVIVTA